MFINNEWSITQAIPKYLKFIIFFQKVIFSFSMEKKKKTICWHLLQLNTNFNIQQNYRWSKNVWPLYYFFWKSNLDVPIHQLNFICLQESVQWLLAMLVKFTGINRNWLDSSSQNQFIKTVEFTESQNF